MNERWKKRVVGTAALIVIAAALLPMLFDGSGYRERHVTNRIPPKPASAQMVEVPNETPASKVDASAVAPDRSADAATAEVSSPVADTAKVENSTSSSSSPSEDTSPRLDEQQVPEAWTLQLASFRDESNAKALKTQLDKSGYKAYIREITDLYKVFVGPEVERDQLEQVKAKLKGKYSLEGIIVRFTPRT